MNKIDEIKNKINEYNKGLRYLNWSNIAQGLATVFAFTNPVLASSLCLTGSLLGNQSIDKDGSNNKFRKLSMAFVVGMSLSTLIPGISISAPLLASVAIGNVVINTINVINNAKEHKELENQLKEIEAKGEEIQEQKEKEKFENEPVKEQEKKETLTNEKMIELSGIDKESAVVIDNTEKGYYSVINKNNGQEEVIFPTKRLTLDEVDGKIVYTKGKLVDFKEDLTTKIDNFKAENQKDINLIFGKDKAILFIYSHVYASSV